MRRSTLYILRELTVSFLLITGVLLTIIWLSQSLRLVDFLVNRGLPFSLFLYMSVLTLPWALSILLPISYFIAVIQSYHRLIRDSEINIMQAVGMSPLALARPAFILGGILCAVGYTITLYIMPSSYKSFENLRHIIKYDYSSVLLQEGSFTDLLDNVTIYIRERGRDGSLKGILIHDSRTPERPVTIIAEEGALVRTSAGPRVVVADGNRQEISRETGQLSMLYFDRYSFNIEREAAQSDERLGRKLPELSLGELLYPENYPYLNPQRHGIYRAQGHQRLLLPLYLIVFPALALALLLGGQYSRRGQSRRIGLIVFAFIVVESLAIALENIAARQALAIPLMYLNVILPLLAALFWLTWPQWGHRYWPVRAPPG